MSVFYPDPFTFATLWMESKVAGMFQCASGGRGGTLDKPVRHIMNSRAETRRSPRAKLHRSKAAGQGRLCAPTSIGQCLLVCGVFLDLLIGALGIGRMQSHRHFLDCAGEPVVPFFVILGYRRGIVFADI